MSTARAEIVKKVFNAGSNFKANLTHMNSQTAGHIVARLDFAAFDASTAPEGIQGLGTSDTIEIAVVNRADARPSRDGQNGRILVKSVRAYTDAAITLGTGNNLSLKVVRGSSSTLADVTIGALPESGGLGSANTLIEVIENVGLYLEENDKLVLVPDGALDGTAAADSDIFVEVSYMRVTPGGRLDQGVAVA